MNKRSYLYIFASFLLMSFAACSTDEQEEGNGLLQLSIGRDSETIQVETKTTAAADVCKVIIKNRNGDIIQKFDDAQEIPAELWLLSDLYTVTATMGTPKKAEFDHPCYAGEETFFLESNKATRQEIKCRLVQSKASIKASEAVKKNFTTYKTTVSMGTNTLIFPKDTLAIGYFYVVNGDESLMCKVEATTKNGTKINKEIKIDDIQPHTHYILNLDYLPQYEDGGFKLELEVKEDAIEVSDNLDIGLKKYPFIKYEDSYSFVLETGKIEHIELTVKGYPLIKSLLLNSTFFNSRFPGLPANLTNFDVMQLTEAELKQFEQVGFVFDRSKDASDKLAHERIKISIPADVSTKFDKADFSVTVTDKYDQKRTGNSSIAILDVKVKSMPIENFNIWGTHTTLQGTWIGEKPDEIGFRYRIAGSSQWAVVENSSITVDTNKKSFTAEVKSLTPGEEYEYQATEVGGKASPSIAFITESNLQIPFLTFDQWYITNKVPYLGTPEQHLWDSGNEGGGAFGFTPTTEETENKIVGSAAKLTSQWALVKFAAGNLYTGDFVKLSGLDVLLDFGIEYTSRPVALTGYYQYQPVKIDRVKPPYNHMEGETDSCHIYIALCDWSAPFRVDTKNNTFVNTGTDNPSIIAYGELKTNNSMDEYEKFRIDLTYRFKNKKPSYILIVASSSKYGDYFTGGAGSTLWLDEFNLEFD